jgi:hypothetical protein
MCAAIDDSGYVENMLATFYAQSLSLLNNMIRAPTNLFHGDLAKKLDMDGLKTNMIKALAFHAGHNRKPLKTYERFKRAGLQDIYESLYWNLCLSGHNTVSAFERRHVIRNGSDIQVVPVKPNSTVELAMYCDALTLVLIDCAFRVHKFLDTNLAANYEKRMSELKAFRTAVHAAAPPDQDRS